MHSALQSAAGARCRVAAYSADIIYDMTCRYKISYEKLIWLLSHVVAGCGASAPPVVTADVAYSFLELYCLACSAQSADQRV